MTKAIILAATALMALTSCQKNVSDVLDTSIVDKYVSEFNASDNELFKQYYPNDKAAEFMKANIPLFDCPDKELEKTYYFRWWTYRKHIRQTPDGFVITEFLPNVGWGGKYNTINCAAQHHVNEGRWLRDPKYLDDYVRFWFFASDGGMRRYSCAAADVVWSLYLVHGDKQLVADVYDELKATYKFWEDTQRDATGLYWRMDGWDGGEESAGCKNVPDRTGYRPMLNSFVYGDAVALTKMAHLLGKADDEAYYRQKAQEMKTLVDTKLWDAKDQFYKTIPRDGKMQFAPCREELGYVPFAYNLPDEDKLVAWEQLFDEKGFKAPYGPTTCEQRAEGFGISYEGHECQWNGPSWPMATSQTITGMINSLNRFGEKVLTKERFMEVLNTFSNSHRLNGQCWIDENINPYTGDWISRTRLMTWENGTWSPGKGGVERGKDYNHSTFNDLIISGLVGIHADEKGHITVNPLVPDNYWDYWCLTGVRCAGKDVTVIYDKNGEHYGKGRGLRVYINGKRVRHFRR